VLYAGSSDGHVYALDASNGTELWRFVTGDSVTSSPAVADGVVYIGSADDRLYAFDLAGGLASAVAANWHVATGYTHMRRLTVNAVPRHATVTVSCAGPGCPFAEETVRDPGRVVALANPLQTARLRPGTHVKVSIAASHAPGKVVTYTIRHKAPPEEAQLCMASIGRSTRACP
jgi:hypothetical protein